MQSPTTSEEAFVFFSDAVVRYGEACACCCEDDTPETQKKRHNAACSADATDGHGRTVFLRTGDLARLEIGGSGRLFISGRIKDLIIVRGRNLYPQVREGQCRCNHH